MLRRVKPLGAFLLVLGLLLEFSLVFAQSETPEVSVVEEVSLSEIEMESEVSTTGSGTDESTTTSQPDGAVPKTEDEILPTESADTESAESGGVLREISKKLFGDFADEPEISSTEVTETIVQYELDQPIIITIPFTDIWAAEIIIPEVAEETPSLFNNIVNLFTGWFGWGNENEEPSSTQTNESDTPSSVIISPAPENAIQKSEDVNESNDDTQSVSWWNHFVPLAFAQSEDETVTTVIEKSDQPVDVEVTEAEIVVIEPSEVIIEVQGIDPVETEDSVATTTTGWVRTSTQTISNAELIIDADTQAYKLNLPPGSLPLGIHEVFVSTTTERGVIDSRFVIDVGGGGVRSYYLDEINRYVVVVTESGSESLWLESKNEAGINYSLVARGDDLQNASPLAVFDGILFYLDKSAVAIRSFDKNANVTTSVTQELDRSIVVTLPSGDYFVDSNDFDFQFVSVEAVVY
jgi:hypothetical protein